MQTLSKENEAALDDCSARIMDVAYSVTQNLVSRQLEHPDENLADVEQSVSQGVWRLLKAEAIISAAATDLQYVLGEGDDDD